MASQVGVGSVSTRSEVWWAADLMWGLKGLLLQFWVKSQSKDSAEWRPRTNEHANLSENTSKYFSINSWRIICEGHKLRFTVSFSFLEPREFQCLEQRGNKRHRQNVQCGHLFSLCWFFIQRCQLICKSLTDTHAIKHFTVSSIATAVSGRTRIVYAHVIKVKNKWPLLTFTHCVDEEYRNSRLGFLF